MAIYRTLELAITPTGVADILLNRPELLNRVDEELHRELTAVLVELRENPQVRAVLLRAAGRVFSAGGDFDLMRSAHADPQVRESIVHQARELVDSLLDLRQPLVTILHGAAVGLGATIVLLSDVIVAAPLASLADSHVALGLVAGDGGCLAWPQSAGMLRARRYLLTGEPIDSATAYNMGLITDLADSPAEALTAGRAIAERIAALPPLAVQGTKEALNRVSRLRADEIIEFSLGLEAQTLASDDLLEGISAFTERRPATFTGR
jgi:enoyl-CoA hydratase